MLAVMIQALGLKIDPFDNVGFPKCPECFLWCDAA
jgi:hypothetical protein